jgi:hypothetical protein
MKRICAFSLAEAMITLLIVCIITIASIPVITKKKRDITQGVHGSWICAKTADNKYITWSREVDSWSSPSDQVCKFVPPHGARNFSVIAIGGGGGGADAISYLLEVLNKTSGSNNSWKLSNSDKEDLSDGYYGVLVAAGGGGGGGANNNAYGKNNQTGSGGAGGWAFGEMLLKTDTTYEYSVGDGGSGGEPRYNGGWKSPRSTHWGGTGVGSYFKIKNSSEINLSANGGGGGEGVGCGKNFWGTMVCGGGTAGSGGNGRSSIASAIMARSLNSTIGRSGVLSCDKAGGKNNYPFPYANNASNAGQGGKSSTCYNSSKSGDKGTSGVVLIGQVRQWHGGGGGAGDISQLAIPTIVGNVEITIPNVALAGQPGGQTKIVVNANRVGLARSVLADGGAAGKAELSNTSSKAGTNSKWTNKGGGAAGPACTTSSGGYEETGEETIIERVCEKYVCEGGRKVDNDPSGAIEPNFLTKSGTKIEMPKKHDPISHNNASTYTLASNFPLLNYIEKGVYSWITSSAYSTPACTVKDVTTDSDGNLNNILVNPYNSTAEFKCYVDKESGCYVDNRGTFYIGDCETEKTKETKVKITEYVPAGSPVCNSAGPGNPTMSDYFNFGAGGGGGSASPILDITGKGKATGSGGKGASGAVIIEW